MHWPPTAPWPRSPRMTITVVAMRSLPWSCLEAGDSQMLLETTDKKVRVIRFSFLFSSFLSSLCAEFSLFLNFFVNFYHPSFLPSHVILPFVPQFSTFYFPLSVFFSHFLSLLHRSFCLAVYNFKFCNVYRLYKAEKEKTSSKTPSTCRVVSARLCVRAYTRKHAHTFV